VGAVDKICSTTVKTPAELARMSNGTFRRYLALVVGKCSFHAESGLSTLMREQLKRLFALMDSVRNESTRRGNSFMFEMSTDIPARARRSRHVRNARRR